jgi:hypothetical protein
VEKTGKNRLDELDKFRLYPNKKANLKMDYSIELDHELKIIRYTGSGILTLETIGKAWEDLLKLNEFTQIKYNLFTDYRGAKSKIKVQEVDLICEHLANLKDILKDKKQALLVNEPVGVAVSMIFEREIIRKIGFNVRVFSTEPAAVNWLIQG